MFPRDDDSLNDRKPPNLAVDLDRCHSQLSDTPESSPMITNPVQEPTTSVAISDHKNHISSKKKLARRSSVSVASYNSFQNYTESLALQNTSVAAKLRADKA